jgi:glycosyltransferase involved in cell wall biosynthesis
MHFLNIGMFQAGFPDPDGTTTAVAGLARALVGRGHRVTVYGCGSPSNAFVPPDGLTIRLYQGHGSFGGFGVPRALLGAIRSNSDALDLLMLNSMFSPSNTRISAAARGAGIPYIVCPHDPYHPALLRKHRWRKVVYGALFERPLLRRAAAVQVLSASHIRHLRSYGIGVTAVVVPNGFFPGDVPNIDIVRLSGDPALLFLGRIDSQHKGHDLLIRALGILRAAGRLPDRLRVHFVGSPQHGTGALQRLADSLGVGAHLEIHGRVPDPVRWGMLAGCDALLLCSRYDGFGLVALEAMLCERAVFVSSEAGISEWVRDARCGFVFDPDPPLIAESLAGALARRFEWADLGRHGRHFAEAHMTWHQMAARAESQYLQLLAERRSAVIAEPAPAGR